MIMNQERLLNEFLELVQIDSETKFETEIAKVLKQKFTDLGVEVFEDDTTGCDWSWCRKLDLHPCRQRKRVWIRFILLPIWIRLFREKELNHRLKMDML